MYNNVRTVAYHLSDMYTCPHMYTQWEIRPFRSMLVLAPDSNIQNKIQRCGKFFTIYNFSNLKETEDLTFLSLESLSSNLVLPWYKCYICVARMSPMIDDQVYVITLTVNM